MCLSIPAKVISIKDKGATLDFFGKRMEAKIDKNLATVKIGDYAMVSNGFIIKKINKREVKEIFKTINTKENI